MAFSFKGGYYAISAVNATAISVSLYPSVPGDLQIVSVAVKPTVANVAAISTPAGTGWTEVPGGAGWGGGWGSTLGDRTGNVYIKTFWRVSPGTVSGESVVVGLSGNSAAAILATTLGGGGNYDLEGIVVSRDTDVAAGADVTNTFADTLDIDTDDWLYSYFAICTSARDAASFSAPVMSRAGGSLDVTNAESAQISSDRGNEVTMAVARHVIGANPSSGAVSIKWSTTTVSPQPVYRGPHVLVRMREANNLKPAASNITMNALVPFVGPTIRLDVPVTAITMAATVPAVSISAYIAPASSNITQAAPTPVISTGANVILPLPAEIITTGIAPKHVGKFIDFDPGLARTVQKLELGSLVILFEISGEIIGPEPLRFVSGTINGATVKFGGNEYFPIPIEADGFEWNGKGPMPRPTVRVANIQGILTNIVANLDDLLGCQFRRIRTFEQFLDTGTDPDADATLRTDVYYFERRVTHNQVFVEFELSSLVDQEGQQLPAEICLKDTCTRTYRKYDPVTGDFDYTKADCPYKGTTYLDFKGNPTTKSKDRCGKRTVQDCLPRFGPDVGLPTRALPGIGDQGY
jgi:lambda family phage minor tail protein L